MTAFFITDETGACDMVSRITRCSVRSESVVFDADDQRWGLDALQLVPRQGWRYLSIVDKARGTWTAREDVHHHRLDTFLFGSLGILHNLRRGGQNRADDGTGNSPDGKPEQEVRLQRCIEQEFSPRGRRDGSTIRFHNVR